jgi:hypothetical protein
MARCSSRKEWLQKRDAMNVQLRAEIDEEKSSADENLEPLPPGIDQLPLDLAVPEAGRARKDRPYYLRDD